MSLNVKAVVTHSKCWYPVHLKGRVQNATASD